MDSFKCSKCNVLFATRGNLNRHDREKHSDIELYTCDICEKTFKRLTHLKRHSSSLNCRRKRPHQDGIFKCDHCDRTFRRKVYLRQHASVHNAEHSPAKIMKKTNRPAEIPSTSGINTDGDEVLLEGIDQRIHQLYSTHWKSIQTHHHEGKTHSWYTIRWDSQAQQNWDVHLLPIFEKQTRRFKINYSHSFILQNRETEEFRFFHASNNNARALEEPQLISHSSDFRDFLKGLKDADVLEHAKNNRPNTKWTVFSIVSTTFYLDKISDYPIGCCSSPMPDVIINNHFIYSLDRNKRGEKYTDQLCFFRCLALFEGASLENLETYAQALLKEWCDLKSTNDFSGLTTFDLELAEDLFSVDIEVFAYDFEQSPPPLFPIRRSSGKYQKVMYILKYENHFCYIKDIDGAGNAFSCSKCGKLWRFKAGLNRHQETCDGTGRTQKYTGGVYTPKSTPLEILADNGIDVDKNFVYPFRATYDFETYFDTNDLPKTRDGSEKTKFIARHVPLSVSVCSNIPGYCEPVCFVTDGNSQDLVNRMIDYLEEMSDVAFDLLSESEFHDVYQQLSSRKERPAPGTLDSETLHKTLDSYLRQLPVVGFNSGKYDVNIMKPFLVRRSLLKENKPCVIKKDNDFMAISTEKWRFLNITNFLAPGYSYAKYLAAYGVKEKKGCFPYEYIRNLDQLNETKLPSKEAFYSSLKDNHISDEDYERCQQIWKDENMKTLKDFLVHYNNKDTVPFLEAISNQVSFYQNLGLDLLKDAISVPGLCLKYLFKTLPKEVYFSLINEKNKDFHELLRQEIVGGPSIIFHRHHEKDKTKIREGKTVKSVIGYDANALYLWCLMQEMPTAHPIRRRKEKCFRAEQSDRFGLLAREWLEWVAETEKVEISHKFNGGEKRLGRYTVDGFDSSTWTAYQFHGCYFHGHHCEKTNGQDHNALNGKSFDQLRAETERISRYLRDEIHVNLVEMWECAWDNAKKDRKDIRDFIKKLPRLQSCLGSQPSKNQITDAVRTGHLFGFVQCDISVPHHLRKYFEEMPPIFKNTRVSRNDIGDFMREFAEEHKLLNQPRRTLIGSYFAKGILLATPLLRWYISHGLIIEDVQQVIEYEPNRCFKAFGETVSDARREGDFDPSKSILAETWKLLGNSAYGKSLENLEKHVNTEYTDDERTVSKLVNEKRFRRQTILGEGLYEVESCKPTIKWNLPLQIGFFVYQYAKLRMLQFHFDFIDRFVDRTNYQLCEMDTDSLYMALSSSNLEESVRPDMLDEFYKEYPSWFPSKACEKHVENFVRKKNEWNPPPCCIKREKYDKRTPGLFKVEYKGDGIVALCSKTYVCFGQDYDKISCKGLNKRQNDVTKEKYLKVLDTKTDGKGINKGFRTDGRTVFTYQQERASLSFFYIKRKVFSDGVSTKPLDI